jgi:hypothetical protein
VLLFLLKVDYLAVIIFRALKLSLMRRFSSTRLPLTSIEAAMGCMHGILVVRDIVDRYRGRRAKTRNLGIIRIHRDAEGYRNINDEPHGSRLEE